MGISASEIKAGDIVLLTTAQDAIFVAEVTRHKGDGTWWATHLYTINAHSKYDNYRQRPEWYFPDPKSWKDEEVIPREKWEAFDHE